MNILRRIQKAAGTRSGGSARLLNDAAAEIKALRKAAVTAVIPLEVICGVYHDRPLDGMTEETWKACFEGRDAVREAIQGKVP